jgi:hypothetical protein
MQEQAVQLRLKHCYSPHKVPLAATVSLMANGSHELGHAGPLGNRDWGFRRGRITSKPANGIAAMFAWASVENPKRLRRI